MITGADLLLVNANVLTMDPGRPRATAVAITGGRILDLPDDPAQLSAERVVDLRGATLLPGFHDAHNHMTWFGLSLSQVDLRSPGIGSLGELYAAVARRAQATAPGEWVVFPSVSTVPIGFNSTRVALDARQRIVTC